MASTAAVASRRALVSLEYKPEGEPAATLAFVGKGITFDAGGLSIKTAQGMMMMKMDMCGAAAIIAAMSVLPAVAAPVRVMAYLPMTDNMLGGDATRPGDVLTIRNGKTIEVLNTDAEGRLILADALSLAAEAEPDAIVDLATLTGACMVALGPSIAGLMGNDDSLIDQVRAAADPGGGAGVASAAARRLHQAVRVERGRHQEHRRPPRRRADRGSDPAAVRARRGPLGPPRHRRAGPGPSPTTARSPRVVPASAYAPSSSWPPATPCPRRTEAPRPAAQSRSGRLNSSAARSKRSKVAASNPRWRSSVRSIPAPATIG